MTGTRKLRVMVVNKRYIPYAQAGPAFSVQYLVEGLLRQGHEASVLCRNPVATGESLVRGVRCYTIDESLPLEEAFDLTVARLDALKPDVLHVYFDQGFPVLRLLHAAQARGIATTHTICTYSYICSRGTMFSEGRRCMTICADCARSSEARREVKSALDGVVFVSQFVKRTHQALGFFDGIPAEDVISCSYDRSESVPVREVTTDSTKPLCFGFLGRIDPAKGLSILLPLFEKLQVRERARLVVAGGAPAPVLPERQGQFPSTRFLGFVPREALFQQIDVLVVPSLWEDPLPRVIYEAYAHGIPVIGSRRGGIPEAIDHEVTGLLFDPVDGDALETAILALANDRPRVVRMSAGALEKAKTFGTPSIVPRYLHVFEQAIAAAKRRLRTP
jgi:glycosyltransferase involved in cell wall biosynthesis